MGILVLLAMSLLHSGDLVASNAVKNWIGFIVTLTATVMFAFYGLIQWLPRLVMAVGNVLGGIAGAKLAIKKGNREGDIKIVYDHLIANSVKSSMLKDAAAGANDHSAARVMWLVLMIRW